MWNGPAARPEELQVTFHRWALRNRTLIQLLLETDSDLIRKTVFWLYASSCKTPLCSNDKRRHSALCWRRFWQSSSQIPQLWCYHILLTTQTHHSSSHLGFLKFSSRCLWPWKLNFFSVKAGAEYTKVGVWELGICVKLPLVPRNRLNTSTEPLNFKWTWMYQSEYIHSELKKHTQKPASCCLPCHSWERKKVFCYIISFPQ